MRAFKLLAASILFVFTISTSVIAGGENNSHDTPCTPDRTVTTTAPVTTCNPYTLQVQTGRSICDVQDEHQDASADFGGTASCNAETYGLYYPNCSTVSVTTTTVVKGNCPVDACTTGGHNCGHGAGPGG
jgi:hypothetical protein